MKWYADQALSSYFHIRNISLSCYILYVIVCVRGSRSNQVQITKKISIFANYILLLPPQYWIVLTIINIFIFIEIHTVSTWFFKW